AKIKKPEKKCKPSISHYRAWLKSVQRISMKKRFGKKESGRISKETKELVSTARPGDDTVRPDVGTVNQIVSTTTTTSIFDDEDITMAQTLIKMKEEKAKEKGVSIKDIKDTSRPVRSILTLKPLSTIDPKDKGKESKAAIVEMYDEVQARIEADALFAAKLQQEERKKYTIGERARFLAETIAAQRKFRVAQRSTVLALKYVD
nr:hypothetical protein [Tanacetum cinerariifolium]